MAGLYPLFGAERTFIFVDAWLDIIQVEPDIFLPQQ